MLHLLLLLAAVASEPTASLPNKATASAAMQKIRGSPQFEATVNAIFDHAMPMLECVHKELTARDRPAPADHSAALQQLALDFKDAGQHCGYAAEHASASAKIKSTFPDLSAAEIRGSASELLNSAILATLM